jgi:hypothetical protein
MGIAYSIVHAGLIIDATSSILLNTPIHKIHELKSSWTQNDISKKE